MAREHTEPYSRTAWLNPELCMVSSPRSQRACTADDPGNPTWSAPTPPLFRCPPRFPKSLGHSSPPEKQHPTSQIIQRAGDLPAHGFGELRVDLRRPHIHMAEQLLDGANVHPAQDQVRRIAVPQHMRRHPFFDPRQLACPSQLAADVDLMQMMPPPLPDSEKRRLESMRASIKESIS